MLRHRIHLGFLATLLLTGAPAFAVDSVTGRQPPALRGNFDEIKPMLQELRDCEKWVEREASEFASAARTRVMSDAARTQSLKECEATNSAWRKLNDEELARVRLQNASRAADAQVARTRLREEQAVFTREEAEVAQRLARWLPKLGTEYRPDGLELIADNPHLLVGSTIAAPFRLVERLSPGSAVAVSGKAYVQIDGIPHDMPLFSTRPFVVIGKVVDVV